MGIPTVTLTRNEFVGVVRNAVSGIGLAPDTAMVTFPIATFLPDADLAPLKARNNEFYEALTNWMTGKVRAGAGRMRWLQAYTCGVIGRALRLAADFDQLVAEADSAGAAAATI